MTRISARSRRWLAVLAASALTFTACGSGGSTATDAAAPAASTAVAEPASSYPQFTAATIDGTQLELGSLEGQDTVLWFWAPW